MAEYDPDHAEEANAVEASDPAAVVGAKELERVGVEGAVDEELGEFTAAFLHRFDGRKDIGARDLLLLLQDVR